MSARTLYSFGYRNRSIEDLVALAEKLDATVADVRFQPYSRQREFGRDNLQRRLPGRYVWLHGFGNEEYMSATAIRLHDPEVALRDVAPILARRSLIVLCMCDHHERCHRRDVIELIAAKFNLPVVLLGADAALKEPAQRSLFRQRIEPAAHFESACAGSVRLCDRYNKVGHSEQRECP